MKCFLGEVKPGESQASSGEGNIRTPRGDPFSYSEQTGCGTQEEEGGNTAC